MLVQLVLDLLLQAGLLLVSVLLVAMLEGVGVTSQGAISVIPVDSLFIEKT